MIECKMEEKSPLGEFVQHREEMKLHQYWRLSGNRTPQ